MRICEGDWEQGEGIIPAGERRIRDRRETGVRYCQWKGKWLDFETQVCLWLFEERLGVVF